MVKQELLKMMTSFSYSKLSQNGVTLLELLIVLMIIGLLVTAAVKTMDVSLQRSRFSSTVKELENLSWAIAGNPELISGGKRSDFGYIGDLGVLPLTLRDLYENYSNLPAWQGPYIKAAFQENPDSYRIDAWGDTYIYPNPNTIVETSPVYVRSYAGTSITTPETWLTKLVSNRKKDLTSNTVEGNFKDAYGTLLGESDKDTVWVKIYLPILGRKDSTYTQFIALRSRYEFTGISVGNHILKAIAVHHDTLPIWDSVEKYICVYPRVGATGIDVRFPAIRFGEW
jgi:prepilin-type N-terminal cleavage/methylation domain-containing protein